MLINEGNIANPAMFYTLLIMGNMAIDMKSGHLDHHQGKEGKHQYFFESVGAQIESG